MKDLFKILAGIAAGFILVSAVYLLKFDSSPEPVERIRTAAVESEDNITVADPPPPSPVRQYLWKSFTTRQRADGFAEVLCRENDIECGVEKMEAGGYRTYFVYTGSADREAKLALLRETSGLTSLIVE